MYFDRLYSAIVISTEVNVGNVILSYFVKSSNMIVSLSGSGPEAIPFPVEASGVVL